MHSSAHPVPLPEAPPFHDQGCLPYGELGPKKYALLLAMFPGPG
eukprot:CAMPEP_0184318724 /NCGR_PEP_ID=MMETSP1049-20130417/104314_1 /TAXON_ID=77928 /ORGANISM="Proteomonas sulcata, Strain CCMP704" /LENGTH=43 /DNA_ID= /DNA_START= /DNA_END= /DNA_ORIENTATION=